MRTDSPDKRLAAGTTLETDPADMGPLTIKRIRTYKDAHYLMFEEVTDRTGAERLRGTELVVETDEEEGRDDDEWYAHELVGLEVLDPDGYTLGTVAELQMMPSQDLMIVREDNGTLTPVPFVKEIVTEIDPEDNCVVVDAPAGLFSFDRIDGDGSDEDDS